MQIIRNALADRAAQYAAEHLAVVSLTEARRAEEFLQGCPLHVATPLRLMRQLAQELRVSRVLVKDETARLGLSSFKALGGAYAVLRRAERSQASSRPVTFVTATDGNHGISVAAGALMARCRSVCFLPRGVSPLYEEAMKLFGAEIVRVDGTYDVAVERAARAAHENGWLLISDTTDESFDPVTRDVISGYGVMVNECMRQLADQNRFRGPQAVTHVFVQAGVGGLAAAFAGGLWQRLGDARPVFVVVEPTTADCLFQSARHGGVTNASGDLETTMGMLSCGRPSRMAWTILRSAADYFVTITDAGAEQGVAAYGREQSAGRSTTPSGAAGLSGLIKVASDRAARELVGINERSVLLTVCSESRPDLQAMRAMLASMRQAVPA
jgi:diaminopropionate ammonia-lyase